MTQFSVPSQYNDGGVRDIRKVTRNKFIKVKKEVENTRIFVAQIVYKFLFSMNILHIFCNKSIIFLIIDKIYFYKNNNKALN